MTDSNLRTLERTFKESGVPEDHLAYLRELVRTGGDLDWESYQALAQLDVEVAAGYLKGRVERGDLPQSKLELAAWAHPAASMALGLEQLEDFSQWSEGTQEALSLTAGAPGRALIALAQFFLQETPRGMSNEDMDAMLSHLEALEDFVISPSRPHRNALRTLHNQHHVAIDHSSGGKPKSVLWRLLGHGIDWTALLSLGSLEDFQAALQADLVPWVLGHSDPVKDRVEARRQEAAERE